MSAPLLGAWSRRRSSGRGGRGASSGRGAKTSPPAMPFDAFQRKARISPSSSASARNSVSVSAASVPTGAPAEARGRVLAPSRVTAKASRSTCTGAAVSLIADEPQGAERVGDGDDVHRLEEAPRHVVQELPAAAVVEARPGGDRPGVVELPVERAHAVRLQAAPVVDGGLDRDALLDLGEPDEVGEVLREAEVAEHRLGDAGVAAGVLLVALHHRGGDVEVGLRRRSCGSPAARGRTGSRTRSRSGAGRRGSARSRGPRARPTRSACRRRCRRARRRRSDIGPGEGLEGHQLAPGSVRFERRLDGAVQPVVGDEVAVAVACAIPRTS